MIHDCADNTCLSNNGIGVCIKRYGQCKYKPRKKEYKRRKSILARRK
jgi:hypothetical protein